MVNLTTKWQLPLFTDTDAFDPIQTPLGLMSTATDTAMTKLYTMGLPIVKSSVERDALYPNKVQGDGVWRTDLGVAERWFDAYSATNLGGAATAGWTVTSVTRSSESFLTAQGGFAIDYARTKLRTNNRVITLQFAGTKPAFFGNNELIATLPVGTRPLTEIYCGALAYGSGVAIGLAILTDGNIFVVTGGITQLQEVRGSASWVI